MKKLAILFLLAAPLWAQTHTFPALDTDNTFTGKQTVKSVNNIQFADQFSGADAWAKIAGCMAAISPEGTCDARGILGSQSVTSSETIAVSNVKLLLSSNVTFTFGASAVISFTGADVEIAGGGSSTVLDFSAGTSSNPALLFQGNRPYIHDLKLIGNPADTTTSALLQVSSTGVGVSLDSPKIERVVSVNSGANGIYLARTIHARVINNTVQTPLTAGIAIDGVTTDAKILNNTVIDPNTSNTAGSSGIFVVNQNNLTDITLVLVQGNTVQFTGTGRGRGMELDSVDNLKILDNFVFGTGATGEGISFTSHNVLVAGNHVSAAANASAQILFFPTALTHDDVTIANNFAFGNINSPGFAIIFGASSITASNINVIGNRFTGNNVGIQIVANGKTSIAISHLSIVGNTLAGNTQPISLDAGVTGFPTIVDDFSVSQLQNGLYFREGTAPTAASGLDACYGDSTAHALECSYNNDSFALIPRISGSVTANHIATFADATHIQDAATTGLQVAFTSKNLAANGAISATTVTVLDSITMSAFPASCGTSGCRIRVSYAYYIEGGVDGVAWVDDGTNNYGQSMCGTLSNNWSICNASYLSPTTFSSGATPTVSIKFNDSGTSEVCTSTSGAGAPCTTAPTNTPSILSRMEIETITSN